MNGLENDDNKPDTDADDIRARLANGSLVVISLIAAPAVAISLWRAQSIGWQPVMGLHVVAALVIWGITIFRSRVPYKWRVQTIVGILFVVGLGGFINFALSGAGPSFMIISVVFSAALLGTRHSIAVLVAGCLAVALVGAGWISQTIGPALDFNTYNIDAGSWLTTLISFALLGGGAITMVAGLNGALIRSIKALRSKSQSLETEAANRAHALAHEISERRTAEASLSNTESRYHMIVDMQSEVITRFKPDGALTFVNRAYCEFVNKTAEELVGTSIYDDVPADDVSRMQAYFAAFTAEEPVRKNENQLRRFDAEMRDFEWSNYALFDGNGELHRIQSVGRDVTEKKLTEAALVASEARYQAVVDGQGELITRFKPDGDFTFVNGAYCRFVGRAADDILSGSIFNDVPDDDVARLKTYLNGFSVNNPVQHIENKLQRHDGEGRDLQWQDTAYFNDQGEVIEYQSVARDVTEERHAQRALEAATVEAQSANVAKSNFLATMSHEIRTPVAGILGLADILLDEGLSPVQEKTVSRIKGAGQSLVTILNDILDLSKIQAGKLEIENIEFNLGQLINDSLDIFYPKASDKGVALGSKIDPGLPAQMTGDPTRLRQILINLLGNAIKFTDSGSVTLRVVVANKTDDAVTLRFEVIDTGIGIAADRAGDLFQDFTQVDASTARKYEGTGLGLAISKRLIELLDGEIGIDSVEGEGSTFWFTIAGAPSQTGSISMPASPSATAFRAVRPLQILLAEDNDLNQMIIKAVLSKFDHRVTTVDDGRAAVETVRNNDFDLILMDVRMPELDGPDATRIIRQSKTPNADIPIIAVTADAIVENRASYTAAGMNACVTKPIDVPELLRAINEVLGEDVHVPADTTA